MRRLRFLPTAVVLSGIALITLTGCSAPPTYKKETLAQSLEQLLKEDNLSASVKLVDHTLAVHIDYAGSLQPGDGQRFSDAFDDVLRKGFTDIHRVVLSSDAQVDFYVFVLSDPKTPGAYLTIVRYLDDVLQANAQMLDTNEFFARAIFKLNYLDQKQNLKLDQYVQRDIQLPEFLSWQMAQRIQQRLLEEFGAASSLEVGRCQGEFRDRQFAFTLNVASTTPGTLQEGEIQQVFDAATGVIQQVLKSYDFKGFDSVRLVHLPTGRNVILPKTSVFGLR